MAQTIGQTTSIQPEFYFYMSITFRGGPPTPEEFQRQLSEFMRQHFPSPGPGAAARPQDDETADSPASSGEKAAELFQFDRITPRSALSWLPPV
jgi:hypothetical protein